MSAFPFIVPVAASAGRFLVRIWPEWGRAGQRGLPIVSVDGLGGCGRPAKAAAPCPRGAAAAVPGADSTPDHILVRTATLSMWKVWGKRSMGCTDATR